MLILLFLFALFQHLQGAPLTVDEGGVADLLPAVHILPRADVVFGTRATSDIVISCLATIFACTWTAIHPNIPSPADSRWDIFKRRFVTTLYALLAPEFITMWAFRQNIAAKRVMKEYNMKIAKLEAMKRPNLDSEQPSFQRLWVGIKKWLSGPYFCHAIPEPEQQPSFMKLYVAIKEWLFCSPPFDRVKKGKVQPWTTTHGFFVQMGGFMLCENGRPIQTLSFSRLKKQIRAKAIKVPRITQAEIEDRSKGDAISKTVVILQTSWFIAQCIARWSTRIPVTELEIITLAFAMLNGVTYALWWNKPQNVGVPVYLEIKAQLTNSLKNEPATSGSSEVRTCTEVPLADPLNTLVIKPQKTDQSHRTTEELKLSNTEDLNDTKLQKQSFLPRKLKEDWDGNASHRAEFLLDIPWRLTETVLRPLSKLLGTQNDYAFEGELRVGIFFVDDGDKFNARVLPPIIGTIAALFGCVHLIPSFFLHYPSSTEMWLWRLSAAFITVQPPLTMLIGYVTTIVGSSPPGWVQVIIVAPLIVEFPLYIFARLALIVLAFLSLRDLPRNAYLTIDWISFIPHL